MLPNQRKDKQFSFVLEVVKIYLTITKIQKLEQEHVTLKSQIEDLTQTVESLRNDINEITEPKIREMFWTKMPHFLHLLSLMNKQKNKIDDELCMT